MELGLNEIGCEVQLIGYGEEWQRHNVQYGVVC